jgi:dTDP-glucose pyrophosphorylase
MNILVPMAGPEEGFRDRGYTFCKGLIDLDGVPLIQRVHENLAPLERDRLIFVIRKEEDERFCLGEVARLLDPRCLVLRAEGPTAGAACTTLLAVEHIDSGEELLITNGDQFFAYDLGGALADFRRRDLDGGTLVFDSVHPRWSYVRLDGEGLVVEAAEKRPISRWATAGFYYFRRGHDYVAAAMEMIRKDAHVRGGFYVCPVFNEMVLRMARIGTRPIPGSAYISLALPEDVEAYSGRASIAGVRDAAGSS